MRHSFAALSTFIGLLVCISGTQAQTPVQPVVSQNLGQVAVNGTPATATLTYSFTGYATPSFALFSPTDFTLKTSTCTGNGNVNCTVTITFAPTLPGLRRNALLVKDVNQKLIATTFLYGTGLAPQAVIYPGVINTVAGKPGVMGVGSFTSGDGGAATQTSFFNPQGIALDNAGNLYVADSLNAVIRKVDAATGLIKTVAGRMALSGVLGDNGPATSAQLSNPVAVAVDGAGNLYIADQGNARIRKVTAFTGIITTVAGGGQGGGIAGNGDGGPAANAILFGPNDIAVDGAGNLYIAELNSGNIRKVSNTGTISTIVSGLANPKSLDIDAAGNLYVAVSSMVKKIDTAGNVTMLAQPGSPACVRVNAAGNVYVADQAKNQVWQINAQNQTATLLAGNSGSGYAGDGMLAATTTLNAPAGLALDASGSVYVSDSTNSIVRRITAVSTLNFPNTVAQQISQSQTISVANVGNQPLTFAGVNMNASFQQQTIPGATCSAGLTLQSGTNCQLILAFAPTTAGSVNGLAMFTDNSLNVTAATQSVGLTGTGITGAAPQISVSVSSLTFGPQAIGTSSTAQTVTITNTGTATLKFSFMPIQGANAGDFILTSTNCGSVAAGQSCTVSAAFQPTGSGSRNAALTFVSNVASAPQIALAGVAGAPQMAVAGSVSFANQVVGTASTSTTISISNSGSAPLSISGTALTGTNAAEYQITLNNCGSAIAPGSSCLISVAFAPRALGLRTASLVLTSNGAANSVQTINLSGKGTPFAAPTVFRPSNGGWYSYPVGVPVNWGIPGDVPVSGDFDGDGKRDFAIFRPSGNVWWIYPSGSGQPYWQQWGLPGDIPVPADYDGDGKTDIAIYRPGTGEWWIIPSSTKVPYVRQWGLRNDIPVLGDYDGDGKADLALFRPSNSTWYILGTKSGAVATSWGLPGDVPTPGDFDGDGKTDIGIYRPATGEWWILRSSTGMPYHVQWGLPGDLAVAADYDGDGKTDFGVYRPSNNTWYAIASRTGNAIVSSWGLPGDMAVKAIAN